MDFTRSYTLIGSNYRMLKINKFLKHLALSMEADKLYVFSLALEIYNPKTETRLAVVRLEPYPFLACCMYHEASIRIVLKQLVLGTIKY